MEEIELYEFPDGSAFLRYGVNGEITITGVGLDEEREVLEFIMKAVRHYDVGRNKKGAK